MACIRFVAFLSFFLTINCCLYAQAGDSLSARKIIDNGTNGDIILGKQNKKDRLQDPPVRLQCTDPVRKKDAERPVKKSRRKKL